MYFKSFVLFYTMTLATMTFAANQKLNNYEEVKAALLSGKEVRVIVDLKNDCNVSDSQHPNAFGFSLSDFVIYAKNGTIAGGIDSLNAAPVEGGGPFGSAAYSLGGINITTKNEITVETAIMTLPNYKTVVASTDHCKFSTSENAPGVKFFLV